MASDVPQHKYRLAALYDSRAETTKAQSTLQAIPSLALFDISRLDYHNDLMELRTLLHTWREQNVDISNLGATQLAALQVYENKTNGIQYKVYPLLALNNASHYLAPIYMPATAAPSSSARKTQEEDRKEESRLDRDNPNYANDATQLFKLNQVSIYPNPTQKILNVAYQLDSSISKAMITISSLEGKVLSTNQLMQNKGVQQIDVSHIRNGQYVCTVSSGGAKLKQLKFAILR